MKFRAYKEAFCQPDLQTLITESDPVRLVLRIDARGQLQWRILGKIEGTILAASGQGYVLEIEP